MRLPSLLHPARRRWVVFHEGQRLRWGGDLRRHYIFSGLAERAGASLVPGWSPGVIEANLPAPRRFSSRPLAACVENLEEDALALVRARARCAVLDVHDDAVLQFDAFGMELDEARRADLVRLQRENVAAFELHVVPSESFGQLAGLDPSRVIVAPNGTDPHVITPGPWPSRPRVAMASGAAPRRGIEHLIEAMRLLRTRHPDVELDLWLVATGDASGAYLRGLREATASDPWIAFGSSGYKDFGSLLSRASVLCVPNPPHPYWEGIVPIKLVDAMAAGRPVVVTPRLEARRLIERAGAGVVARDDSVEGLAEALDHVISDEQLARKLGAAARETAEREFDWGVISARLARELVKRRW